MILPGCEEDVAISRDVSAPNQITCLKLDVIRIIFRGKSRIKIAAAEGGVKRYLER